jgi:peroxiredoxin
MRIGFGAVISLLAAAILATNMAWAQDDSMTPLDIPMIGDMEALQIGEPAPAFTVKDVTGQSYKFVPEGKAHMLIFWSIFCEPCRAEMPMIQGTFEKYKDQGLEVLAVALDGDLVENIKQFAKQGGFTFTVLLDEEDEDGSLVVAENFMVPGTPTIYVVDTKGKIAFSKVGRVDEIELHKAIEGALGK